jgi:Tfp pilus assembly protein PilO
MDYQPQPDSEWPFVAGIIGVFVLLTAVITLLIWQRAATARARAVLAREKEYRDIAEGSLAAQEQTKRHLADIVARLDEMQNRLNTLERILREVE